jgi:hypothetical protein
MLPAAGLPEHENGFARRRALFSFHNHSSMRALQERAFGLSMSSLVTAL